VSLGLITKGRPGFGQNPGPARSKARTSHKARPYRDKKERFREVQPLSPSPDFTLHLKKKLKHHRLRANFNPLLQNSRFPGTTSRIIVKNIKIFSGNATPELAQKVAENLNKPLGSIEVDTFSDGEIRVEINENVRGRNIFIIQSTCHPCNNNLMELLIMADAFKRSSTLSITAIIPYFGYARQDRRVRSARVPITAKLIADTMKSVGIDRIITADLHADQIQGFFDIPVDNIYASPIMLEKDHQAAKHPNLTIVSPDVGGVVRARAIAKRLNDTELAIIDKRRPRFNQTEVMNVIGEVIDRHCIIVDDIVDTAGTLCAAAQALKDQGARSVSAYCTHPVLSGNAIDNINHSPLEEVIVSDTIPLRKKASDCAKIRQVSLSTLISETISRIEQNQSVSSMFNDPPTIETA
jgi:ribose-phosphate pyrophosphokinase